VRDDEAPLTAAIIQLASAYGRYGYRRVTALLRAAGWRVNRKRVLRIWQREGLKVPAKQSKRGRLWLNDGRVSGCGHSTLITCGLTISWPTAPSMGDRSKC
jgi:transposase InsO family protein